MKTMSVKIAELIKDKLQVRVRMNNNTVEAYAEVMSNPKTKKPMPPVVVFRDAAKGLLYLADGFHRVAAAERIGRTEIEAEVREGTFADALTYALTANEKNALQMTKADVNNVYKVAWENRKLLIPDCEPGDRNFVTKFSAICHISRQYAYILIDKFDCKQLTNSEQSDEDETESGIDRAHDLTRGNRMHTDERNPSKKKLLKEGRDQFGVVIPERLLAAFRSSRPKECQQKISEARMAVSEALKSGDPAFAGIGPRVFIDLDNAMHQIAYGKPFCVCRGCRGEGCDFCLSRGFQTQLQYRNLPREFMHHKQ